MHALIVDSPGFSRIAEREIPSPGKGQTLVRVIACGLCGTDYKIFSGRTHAEYPIIPGHEITGIVEESEEFEKGQMVVIDPNRPCGRCRFCKSGRPHFCEHLRATGVTESGGFSEYVIVWNTQVYPVKNVPPERAVFAEPLSCVLNGLRRIKGEFFERVLILGAGSIGMIFGLMLKRILLGAEIVLWDVDETRAEHVSKNFDLKVEPPKGSYDLTVECSGSVEGFKTCFDFSAFGGVLLQFGVVDKDKKVEVSPYDLYRKELRIQGTYLNPFTMGEAVRIIESGELLFEKLVTDRLDLEGVRNYLQNNRKALVKAVFWNH